VKPVLASPGYSNGRAITPPGSILEYFSFSAFQFSAFEFRLHRVAFQVSAYQRLVLSFCSPDF
jgi:hypothetical protein